MRHARNRDRGHDVCRHAKTTRTVNVGLARNVCEECGRVSFEYAHGSLSDEAVALIEQRNAELAAPKKPE